MSDSKGLIEAVLNPRSHPIRTIVAIVFAQVRGYVWKQGGVCWNQGSNRSQSSHADGIWSGDTMIKTRSLRGSMLGCVSLIAGMSVLLMALSSARGAVRAL